MLYLHPRYDKKLAEHSYDHPIYSKIVFDTFFCIVRKHNKIICKRERHFICITVTSLLKWPRQDHWAPTREPPFSKICNISFRTAKFIYQYTYVYIQYTYKSTHYESSRTHSQNTINRIPLSIHCDFTSLLLVGDKGCNVVLHGVFTKRVDLSFELGRWIIFKSTATSKDLHPWTIPSTNKLILTVLAQGLATGWAILI